MARRRGLAYWVAVAWHAERLGEPVPSPRSRAHPPAEGTARARSAVNI
jgi:hypothetical protein